MDVNFIASGAAEDYVHIAVPTSPPRANNNSNGNGIEIAHSGVAVEAGAPMYLVPPTPTPPPRDSFLSNFTRSNPNTVHSAPADSNGNGNGNGNGHGIRWGPTPTLIVGDTPPPTRRSIHNLYDAPGPLAVTSTEPININNNNNSDNAAESALPFHLQASSGDSAGGLSNIRVLNLPSFVPVVNIPQRESRSSQPPRRPISLSSGMPVSHNTHSSPAPAPGQQHPQQQQQQSIYLEPNSANSPPSAQAPNMPLFLESNIIGSNPININIEPTPNNAEILPPINLNVNTSARYSSSPAPPPPPNLTFPIIPPLAVSRVPAAAPPSLSAAVENLFHPENQRKRKRVDTTAVAPVAVKKKEADVIVDADTEDANCCTICLEPWNRSGPHQLSCLPCGHLFGRSCIDQWLKRRKVPSVCPTCKFSMKNRKATLIFGAPHKLVTVDQGEIDDVKAKLEKEKEAHEKTKKKLKEKVDEARLMRSRLRNLTHLQVLGGVQHNSHHVGQQPQLQQYTRSTRATLQERRNALMNAVRSVHERRTMEDSSTPGGFALPTVRTSRSNGGILDVAARLPNIMQTSAPIDVDRMPGGATASTVASSESRMEVALMFDINTHGGSKALAFDDSGNVIFNERKPIALRIMTAPGTVPPSDMAVQKICRRPIVGNGVGAVTSRCRSEIHGRINDICANTHAGNSYRGYISVCVQSKKVLILNRALDEVVSYATPSIPLCSWWVGNGNGNSDTEEATNPNGNNNHSHILLVGLTDGTIMAFDMRNSSLGPMEMRKISGSGPIAVHTIAQVGTTILAATPTRIVRVSFGQFSNAINLHQILSVPPGELCSSMAIHRNYILVSVRQNNSAGKHTIYNGLSSDHSTFGNVLQTNLTGHKMGGLFEQAAILSCPDNSNSNSNIQSGSPLVFAPDMGDHMRFTRFWQRGSASSTWPSTQIAPYPFTPGVGQTAVVKTLALPNRHSSSSAAGSRLRIGNAPMVGMVAHLGDNSLQIFSVVRR